MNRVTVIKIGLQVLMGAATILLLVTENYSLAIPLALALLCLPWR